MEKETFDYDAAVKELETIAQKVEDPSVSLDDVDAYVKRTTELLEACRSYLRGAREKLSSIDV